MVVATCLQTYYQTCRDQVEVREAGCATGGSSCLEENESVPARSVSNGHMQIHALLIWELTRLKS